MKYVPTEGRWRTEDPPAGVPGLAAAPLTFSPPPLPAPGTLQADVNSGIAAGVGAASQLLTTLLAAAGEVVARAQQVVTS